MGKLNRVCFDRLLPTDLNRPPRPILPSNVRSRAAFEYQKLWPLGASLRVLFLGGTDTQKDIVKQFAPEWTQCANLKFAFVNDLDAEVRIDFNPDLGAWSYIGQDCLTIPEGQPTMNLGWQDEGVVLHEFGHAIGLIHEHQNPFGGIHWNKDNVYTDLGNPPNSWDRPTVDRNMFQTYDRDQTNGTAVDKLSIMLYAVPDRWTTDGFQSDSNDVLSETDRSFAHDPRNYPFTGPRMPHVNP